eukprot:1143859-Pelagomonas_calceolata.AAC.6
MGDVGGRLSFSRSKPIFVCEIVNVTTHGDRRAATLANWVTPDSSPLFRPLRDWFVKEDETRMVPDNRIGQHDMLFLCFKLQEGYRRRVWERRTTACGVQRLEAF